jgi:hypothetical protein
MILPLTNQLNAAFSRGRISNENVQKTVPNFTGVVASLAPLHKQTFQDFVASTKVESGTEGKARAKTNKSANSVKPRNNSASAVASRPVRASAVRRSASSIAK